MARKIDFTVMYATHEAFRRDLARITAAAAAGTVSTPQIRAGWENFKHQLHIHHTVEDSDLWPRLRRAVSRPQDLALVEEMVDEHAQIDPLLDAADTALTGPATTNLSAHLRELSAALNHHLTHEEEDALPLIQSALEPADWRAFTSQMARHQGIKGAAVYVPWVLDERSPAEQRRFLAAMPPPVRLINRIFWQPRYSQRNLWNTRIAPR
jgi:hemerythrin-like domain-containing protein